MQPSTASGGFEDLLSLDDVDHIIGSMGIRLPAFRLVQDGKTLPSTTYTKTTRTGTQPATGVVDADAVLRRFSSGATIVLQGMHRYWRPLARFCRHLELALGHPVQANAYVTPPGSQGLHPHEDEHDVFVLQSHGTKRWLVYQRGDLPPSRPPVVEAELAPGDSLYIPRAFPHAAVTQEEASVHVTIGILTVTWRSVLRAAVSLAERDPALAEPLPLRFAQQPDALRRAIQERLAELGDRVAKADPDAIGDRLRRRLLTTRQPVLPGQLRQLLELVNLTDASIVARRDTAMVSMTATGDELSVLLGDRELRMPAWLEAAMEDIIGRDRFAVAELAAHLDEPGRRVLVHRLIVEGLLEVVG